MQVRAEAPANLALVKYMGKNSTVGNVPMNPSLSFTLNHLKSVVELEKADIVEDKWESLSLPEVPSLKLSEAGQKRFLDHLQYLKVQFQIEGNYIVRSNNLFPHNCGLASSASSFAALTACAAKIIEQKGHVKKAPSVLARLSQVGSGSSCRSFFSPWAEWDRSGTQGIDIPYIDVQHMVIVVDGNEKAVSSSQAHNMIRSSLCFVGRAERAKRRFVDLKTAFYRQDWETAFETVWADFWDMHTLFETSEPSFGYMTPESLSILNYAKAGWRKSGDGPLVTMDAGPNVHLLFRADQVSQMSLYHNTFGEKFQIISSAKG
jgi:diphosphomevalonate decarboxylase